jgi:hypothetical protein
MYAIHSYDAICDELKRGFAERYRHRTNVTGLIFARPQSELAKSEIIPNIEHWFHRSDFYTDFFLGGYAVNAQNELPDKERVKDEQPVNIMPREQWFFSPLLFNQFLQEMESRTTWRYSGGTDFILATARYDEHTKNAWIDFDSPVSIDLELAKHDDAILNVPHLFETIFRLAKDLNESTEDPAKVISDKIGLSIAQGGLKEFILSSLPESLRKSARSAFHFASKNFKKKD